MAITLSAQSMEPRFDVVAIKPLGPKGGPVPMSGTPYLPGGEFRDPGTNLRTLIAMAYGFEDLGLKIIGLPRWAEAAGYAVNAKAGPEYPMGLSPKQNETNLKAMLRSMLADRFHLQMHQEERPTKVLVLQAKNGGAKLQPVPAPVPPEKEGFLEAGYSDRRGGFRGKKVTMAKLADSLTLMFRMPVVDRTGLDGFYDIEAKWETPVRQDEPVSATAFGPLGQAQVVSILDQNLGLILKPETLPANYWIVDHVEMPGGN